MKKLLLSIAVFTSSVAVFAQQDTLSSITSGGDAYAGYVDAASPIDSGFIAGTNIYGDLAKMQLFDATYGVTNGGSITGLAYLTVAKVDGGGSAVAAIWSDNAGTPVTMPIATQSVTLASMDTTAAGLMSLADGSLYNNVVMFANPVAIPAGNKFWAGFVLPTGNSDLFALAVYYPFADAATHTGEFQSDGSFHTFDDGTNATWQADLAIAVYPIVNFTLGIGENSISANVYPNPAAEVLNIETTEAISSIVVTTMDGKVVTTATDSKVSVAGLEAGMYNYVITTVSGKVGNGKFIKK